MPENNGRVKWLMWIVGFVLMVSLFLVGLNMASIKEMPEKYVRLERYKCDMQDIKAALIRIEYKL